MEGKTTFATREGKRAQQKKQKTTNARQKYKKSNFTTQMEKCAKMGRGNKNMEKLAHGAIYPYSHPQEDNLQITPFKGHRRIEYDARLFLDPEPQTQTGKKKSRTNTIHIRNRTHKILTKTPTRERTISKPGHATYMPKTLMNKQKNQNKQKVQTKEQKNKHKAKS